MSPEKAIQWLEREGFNQWILYRGEDEKVSSYDSENESVADGIERFTDIIDLQSTGKYVLKGYKGKSKQASAVTFRFEIKPEPVAAAPRQNFGSERFDPQALFDKAKEAALREFETAQWKKDVEKRLSALESAVEDIRKATLDLNDEDEDNDDSAIDRLSNGAAKLPGLIEGFNSMRGLLK